MGFWGRCGERVELEHSGEGSGEGGTGQGEGRWWVDLVGGWFQDPALAGS